ncbi:trigger factor [Capnocytophaga gingivalis]|uniref:Trigger factor n=1 Tax=Capnocytophaga gingivalis TaxID=1017 RepID=A0ABU5ZAT4_9FLAO|nr:trigger factor [Capnocytophaga gingivalis]MEB3075262.1 trigger factor [Capnocytophaga gingivalis]
MKISKEQIDALNAVITLEIDKSDYQGKVEEALNNYRKNASIPGFRKGHVPMGMVKKQYEKAIQADELNKLISESLNKFIEDEKLRLLGQPIPKEEGSDANFLGDHHKFVFEIGLEPEFTVDLSQPIDYYDIKVTDKEIDTQIEHLRGHFGTYEVSESISEKSQISGTFFNEAEQVDKFFTFAAKQLGEKAFEALKGKKVGDQLSLSTKGLFKDPHLLMQALEKPHDVVHDLDIEVTFTIEKIEDQVLADMNEEFFQKVYPDTTTEADFREKVAKSIKEDFDHSSDVRLLDDATEMLIEKTKFDLPADFLKRWIRATSENPITEEEAAEDYENSEKGLRYQLIEGKIVEQNNLQVSYQEIRDFCENAIRAQMARFGLFEIGKKELDNFVNNTLKERAEVERIHRELTGGKLIEFYKEKANLNKIEIDIDSFIEKFYSHQHHH